MEINNVRADFDSQVVPGGANVHVDAVVLYTDTFIHTHLTNTSDKATSQAALFTHW